VLCLRTSRFRGNARLPPMHIVKSNGFTSQRGENHTKGNSRQRAERSLRGRAEALTPLGRERESRVSTLPTATIDGAPRPKRKPAAERPGSFTAPGASAP
jgi:hypothetical protein